MLPFTKLQGFLFEGSLKTALNRRAGFEPDSINLSFLLTEEQIKKKYGTCVNSKGKNIVGVDILCFVNGRPYAIQCKQYSSPVPKKSIQDFIDYSIFLERKIGQEIIKVFSSSMKSTKPGNLLGDSNNFNWIIYSNTSVLIDNTVSWIFDGKEYLHADGDCIME
jgi:hypothetical protein